MPETEINYFAHLSELRNRLMIITASIAVLSVVSFFYSEPLMKVVTAPIRRVLKL